MFLYVLADLIWSIVDCSPEGFLNITWWGWTLIALAFFFSTICSARQVFLFGHNLKAAERSGSRWYHSAAWVLSEIAFSFAVVISLIYWAGFKGVNFGTTGTTKWRSINHHVVNVVFVLVELCISRWRYSWTHLLLVTAVAILYMLVNLFYSTTVRPIYPQITWHNSLSIFLVLLGYVLLVLTFAIALTLAFLRDRLSPPPSWMRPNRCEPCQRGRKFMI